MARYPALANAGTSSIDREASGQPPPTTTVLHVVVGDIEVWPLTENGAATWRGRNLGVVLPLFDRSNYPNRPGVTGTARVRPSHLVG